MIKGGIHFYDVKPVIIPDVPGQSIMVLSFFIEENVGEFFIQVGLLFQYNDPVVPVNKGDPAFLKRPFTVVLSPVIIDKPIGQLLIYGGIERIKVAPYPSGPMHAKIS